jgi:hypothetical protein
MPRRKRATVRERSRQTLFHQPAKQADVPKLSVPKRTLAHNQTQVPIKTPEPSQAPLHYQAPRMLKKPENRLPLHAPRSRDHAFTVTYRAATVRERSRQTLFHQPAKQADVPKLSAPKQTLVHNQTQVPIKTPEPSPALPKQAPMHCQTPVHNQALVTSQAPVRNQPLVHSQVTMPSQAQVPNQTLVGRTSCSAADPLVGPSVAQRPAGPVGSAPLPRAH